MISLTLATLPLLLVRYIHDPHQLPGSTWTKLTAKPRTMPLMRLQDLDVRLSGKEPVPGKPRCIDGLRTQPLFISSMGQSGHSLFCVPIIPITPFSLEQ
jgi:hypothetical protein